MLKVSFLSMANCPSYEIAIERYSRYHLPLRNSLSCILLGTFIIASIHFAREQALSVSEQVAKKNWLQTMQSRRQQSKLERERQRERESLSSSL